MQVWRQHQYRLDSQLPALAMVSTFSLVAAAAVVAANTILFQPSPQFVATLIFIFIAEGDGLGGDQQTALEAITTAVLPLLAARLPDLQRLVEAPPFSLLFLTGVMSSLVEFLPP